MIKQFKKIHYDIWRIILRENTYGNTLAKFERLFVEASKDFPGLKTTKVHIVLYGGDHAAGMYGLEFTVNTTPPDSYEEIEHLPTLS